jgi:hypothetical protein
MQRFTFPTFVALVAILIEKAVAAVDPDSASVASASDDAGSSAHGILGARGRPQSSPGGVSLSASTRAGTGFVSRPKEIWPGGVDMDDQSQPVACSAMFKFNPRWFTAGVSAIVLCLCCPLGIAQPVIMDDGPWQEQTRKANMLQLQGQHREAESILVSVVRDAKRLDLQDADLAVVLNDLGGLYLELGRYADAERHLRRSLALLDDPSVQCSRDWLRTANNLVSLYTEMGEFDRASPLAERVVKASVPISHIYPLDRARTPQSSVHLLLERQVQASGGAPPRCPRIAEASGQ